MAELEMVAILLLLLSGMTTLEYSIECPHPSQRSYRASVFCNGTPASWYSCLYNVHTRSYVEDCNLNPDFVRKGERYVISGKREDQPCSEDRYQPLRFWSNTSTNCLLKKSPCSEIGQIVYKNGSTKEDATCRCDHGKSYGFLGRTKDLCFCLQSEEDCTCYKKQCPNGQKLYSGLIIHNVTNRSLCIMHQALYYTMSPTDYYATCISWNIIREVYPSMANTKLTEFHCLELVYILPSGSVHYTQMGLEGKIKYIPTIGVFSSNKWCSNYGETYIHKETQSIERTTGILQQNK
ncbi:unnamed protein product [Mytilus coruscus]|uniref:Uncharacterized protein n=1 Tax=Mytilus coruscus TaxID=42192 RepID=A0A6J8A2Q2_MYTCO|nr:unnamed protein product [Mytilus coruscus]